MTNTIREVVIMAELIQRTDDLNTGREKLNNAIVNADEAKQKSNQAVNVSEQAKQIAQTAENKADNVQEQFNQVVIEGDSSVEAAQARVTADGRVFDTLRDRLNYTDAQLAETDENVAAIRHKRVFVEDFPKLPGDTDDRERIMRAFQSLNAHDTLVLNGDYIGSGLVFDKDDITIEFTGKITQPKEEDGTALQIGSFNKSTSNLKVIGRLYVVRDLSHAEMVNDWSENDTIGVDLVNLYRCEITVGAINNFKTGLMNTAMDTGNVYNSVHIMDLRNNKTNIGSRQNENGWWNSNNFYGGSLRWDSTLMDLVDGETPLDAFNRLGFIHVHISDRRMNNNNFFGMSFESLRRGGAFIVNEGSYNKFIGVRLEASNQGDSVFIINGENAQYNEYNPGYLTFFEEGVQYIDHGSRNRVLTRFLHDTPSVYHKVAGVKIKQSTGELEAWVGYDRQNDGLVDVQSTSSNTDKTLVLRDVNGNPTFTVNGNGSVEIARGIKTANFSVSEQGRFGGTPKLPYVASLPPATQTNEHRFLIVQESGKPDRFCVCLRQADGSYKWLEVGGNLVT